MTPAKDLFLSLLVMGYKNSTSSSNFYYAPEKDQKEGSPIDGRTIWSLREMGYIRPTGLVQPWYELTPKGIIYLKKTSDFPEWQETIKTYLAAQNEWQLQAEYRP